MLVKFNFNKVLTKTLVSSEIHRMYREAVKNFVIEHRRYIRYYKFKRRQVQILFSDNVNIKQVIIRFKEVVGLLGYVITSTVVDI
jgi:hypothetical protein